MAIKGASYETERARGWRVTNELLWRLGKYSSSLRSHPPAPLSASTVGDVCRSAARLRHERPCCNRAFHAATGCSEGVTEENG